MESKSDFISAVLGCMAEDNFTATQASVVYDLIVLMNVSYEIDIKISKFVGELKEEVWIMK